MPEWYLYLVRTRQDTLYTGIATDVGRRLREHADGKGARYLRGRGPLQLLYQVRIGDRSRALRLERAIKRLDRARKEAIIHTAPGCEELQRHLGMP